VYFVRIDLLRSLLVGGGRPLTTLFGVANLLGQFGIPLLRCLACSLLDTLFGVANLLVICPLKRLGSSCSRQGVCAVSWGLWGVRRSPSYI